MEARDPREAAGKDISREPNVALIGRETERETRSMNILKLAMAAAIAFGTVGLASAPVAAQGRHSGEMRHDGPRHDAGRGDNRRHRGWNNNRGRHRGWRTRRVCRNVWRHHQRQRVCRTVRYRRR
jgi:hypothetical protein